MTTNTIDATLNGDMTADGRVVNKSELQQQFTAAGTDIDGLVDWSYFNGEAIAGEVAMTFSSAGTTEIEPFQCTSTFTGAGVTGCRWHFISQIQAAAGSYSNALKGEVIYNASGKTTGLGSAVLAEMQLSAGTVDGTYAPLEVELGVGSGASTGTATSFIYMGVYGADAATFDANGFLFNIAGLTAGSGDLFDSTVNTTTPQIDHTLKIKIGASTYYIPLMDNADGS